MLRVQEGDATRGIADDESPGRVRKPDPRSGAVGPDGLPSVLSSEPSHRIERELTILHTGRRVVHQGTHFTDDDDPAAPEDERDALTVAGG